MYILCNPPVSLDLLSHAVAVNENEFSQLARLNKGLEGWFYGDLILRGPAFILWIGLLLNKPFFFSVLMLFLESYKTLKRSSKASCATKIQHLISLFNLTENLNGVLNLMSTHLEWGLFPGKHYPTTVLRRRLSRFSKHNRGISNRSLLTVRAVKKASSCCRSERSTLHFGLQLRQN